MTRNLKRTPNRLFKSFIWIIAFTMVTLGIMGFYEYKVKHQQYINAALQMQESMHMLQELYARYSAVLEIKSQAPRATSDWKGFGLLKVHKAASTTTQAIFLRYGWVRNLTFVLPPEYNVFKFPNIISLIETVTSSNILPPPSGKIFDILCHHVVYNKQAWDNVLPNHTANIGTIREPFDHFRSVINYFNPQSFQSIRSKNPVRTFLQNPKLYESRDVRYSFTNNRIAFEFGVDPIIIQRRDFQKFENYLWDVLDKEFIVVLISEKYDESLVLMKRKLNWKLQDILYIAQNVRASIKEDRYVMGEDEKVLHKHYAVFDYLIYNFFDKRFEKDIANENGFTEEVLNFKKVRQSVYNYCRTVHLWPSTLLNIEKTEWNEGFTVTIETCSLLYWGEIAFTQNIRKRQYGYANWVMDNTLMSTN